MNLINSTPAANDLTPILDDMSTSLLNELTQLEGDLTNENVITFLQTASRGAMLYNWMIGRVLVKVEEAISNNTPGFEYRSLSEWFDDYEQELPFKRSAAKQYKDIAKSFTREEFSHINYTKAKTILKVKDEQERTAILSKAIEENLSTSEIQDEINNNIKAKLLAAYNTSDDYGTIELHDNELFIQKEKSKNENMYGLSAQQWNPFWGCNFDCIYCMESSFQSFGDRRVYDCAKCNKYEPHEHPERLLPDFELNDTPYMKFIFTCSSGDISFCRTEYLQLIINRIKQESDKNFLIQSKNPGTFNRVRFPKNVILGTTIETNRDGVYRENNISKAPVPSKRYEDFLNINHYQKMVTLEPLLDFDLDVMIEWICNIDPAFVWIGTDDTSSFLYKNKLEPSIDKIIELYVELGIRGYAVMLKDKLIKRIQLLNQKNEVIER